MLRWKVKPEIYKNRELRSKIAASRSEKAIDLLAYKKNKEKRDRGCFKRFK